MTVQRALRQEIDRLGESGKLLNEKIADLMSEKDKQDKKITRLYDEIKFNEELLKKSKNDNLKPYLEYTSTK